MQRRIDGSRWIDRSICIYIQMYECIYIYMERERGSETERERERERARGDFPCQGWPGPGSAHKGKTPSKTFFI